MACNHLCGLSAFLYIVLISLMAKLIVTNSSHYSHNQLLLLRIRLQ